MAPQQKPFNQTFQATPKAINPFQPIQQIPPKQNHKLTSAYRTSTNTVVNAHTFNPHLANNLNLFQTEKKQKNNVNNNFIAYNIPESARATMTNDKINIPENPFRNKDVDVKYNDFDSSGYVKTYGGVSRSRKDSSGKQKTNQDALVCITNINNIKDFNFFGILDGHGPEGHFVSKFAS